MKIRYDARRMKDVAVLSLFVVLLQLVLSNLIYPLFGASTQNLYSISPATALTSETIGTKVIGFLAGILPFSFNIGTIVLWFVGAFVMLFLGFAIYDLVPRSFQGKKEWQRIAFLLFYGSAILYAFLLFTGGNVAALTIPLLIGVVVNYVLIAAGIVLLAKYRIVRV